MTLSSHFGAYAWTSAATRHIPFVQPNVDVVDRQTLFFIMQMYTKLLVVLRDTIRYLSSLQLLQLRGHLTIVQRVNTPTLLPFYGRQTIEILRRILGFNYLRAPGGFWIALYPQAPGQVFRELLGIEKTVLACSAAVFLASALVVAHLAITVLFNILTQLILVPLQRALRTIVKCYLNRRPHVQQALTSIGDAYKVLQNVTRDCIAVIFDNATYHSSVNLPVWRAFGIFAIGALVQNTVKAGLYGSTNDTRTVSWGTLIEALIISLFVYEGVYFPDDLNLDRSIIMVCDAFGYSTTVLGLIGLWEVAEAGFTIDAAFVSGIVGYLLNLAKQSRAEERRTSATLAKTVHEIPDVVRSQLENTHVREEALDINIYDYNVQTFASSSTHSSMLPTTLTDTMSDHASNVTPVLPRKEFSCSEKIDADAEDQHVSIAPVISNRELTAANNNQETNWNTIQTNGVISVWRTNIDKKDQFSMSDVTELLPSNDKKKNEDCETASSLSFHYPGASESDGENQLSLENVTEVPTSSKNQDIDYGCNKDTNNNTPSNSTVLANAQLVFGASPQPSIEPATAQDIASPVEPTTTEREIPTPDAVPMKPNEELSSLTSPPAFSSHLPEEPPSPSSTSSVLSQPAKQPQTRPKFPSRYDMLNKTDEFYTQRAREIMRRPKEEVPIWWHSVTSPTQFSYEGTHLRAGKGWNRGKPIDPPKSIKNMACGKAVWNSFLVDYVDYLQELLPDQLNIHDGNLNLALCERIIWEVDGFDYKQFPRGEHIRW